MERKKTKEGLDQREGHCRVQRHSAGTGPPDPEGHGL